MLESHLLVSNVQATILLKGDVRLETQLLAGMEECVSVKY